MYRWWRFTPLFSLLTTNFIYTLPLFVFCVVLTRDYALLRGIKQGSLQDSTDAFASAVLVKFARAFCARVPVRTPRAIRARAAWKHFFY